MDKLPREQFIVESLKDDSDSMDVATVGTLSMAEVLADKLEQDDSVIYVAMYKKVPIRVVKDNTLTGNEKEFNPEIFFK